MVTLTAFKAENFGILRPLRSLKHALQTWYDPSATLQSSNRMASSGGFIEPRRSSSTGISSDPAFAINSPHEAHEASTPLQASSITCSYLRMAARMCWGVIFGGNRAVAAFRLL